jgi:hypothetical protein
MEGFEALTLGAGGEKLLRRAGYCAQPLRVRYVKLRVNAQLANSKQSFKSFNNVAALDVLPTLFAF